MRERGLARYRGEQPPAQYEFKLLTKQGDARWIELRATSGPHIGGAVLEPREPDAVKPRQAAAVADLQPPVAGLEQAIDRVVRQALVARPHPPPILDGWGRRRVSRSRLHGDAPATCLRDLHAGPSDNKDRARAAHLDQ